MTIAASMAITLLLLLTVVGSAAANTKFGANFNANTQPSNGAPAHHCKPDDTATCTWVMNFAFSGAGTTQLPLRAPKDGKIGKIKILSATSGSFRLLLARTKSNPTRSKVVRAGPSLSYNGNGGADCCNRGADNRDRRANSRYNGQPGRCCCRDAHHNSREQNQQP